MLISQLDMRDALIEELILQARKDSRVMFLTNDYGAPSLDRFRAEFPEQFVNAAISEQNMVAVAAGLALSGKKVYVYSIASFLTLRCLEQIKIDICAMKLPVTFIGVGTAYAYSYDGPTHHATEDVSIMRALAHMTILSPSDSAAAAACADFVLRLSGPSYVRLDRGKMPLLFDASKDDLEEGSKVVRAGGGLALISTGSTVHRVLEVAELLEQVGVATRVIDLYRLKPVDPEILLSRLEGCEAVVSLEEHTIHGGLGSIVAETLMDSGRLVPLKRLAIEDPQLYAYGLRDTMHRERGLDAEGAAVTIADWLRGLNQSKE